MIAQKAEHRTPRRSDEKLAILEFVLQRDSARLSTLIETLSLDDVETRDVLLELRDDDLVSACPLDEDDLVVTSLPRLRDQDRTKIHRLLYN